MSPASASTAPEAPDPTSIAITKAWNSGTNNWDLTLSWSGGTAPYTVSYSTDASYQSRVSTLAQGTSSTSLTQPADAAASLECFSVSDASMVSVAVQGMGYDPAPAPQETSLAGTGLWWGDPVTVNGSYFDEIAKANVVSLYDLPVRASHATPAGNGYASDVDFNIPDDARSCPVFVQAHGRSATSSVPFLALHPPGIGGPFTNIRSVVYAPQTGHVWVAADGLVEEIDLFLHSPQVVGTPFTSFTWPYLSRVTNDGRILLIDAANPGTIYQFSVTSPATPQAYAATKDAGFTRTVAPAGIAADQSGSYAYIADASLGSYYSRVLRVPAGNSAAIRDSYGGVTYWSFPDPCGMDTAPDGSVLVGWAYDSSQGYFVGEIPAGGSTTNWLAQVDAPPESVELDRDISTVAYAPWYWDSVPDAEAFNLNSIGANPAKYHGGVLLGLSSGYVELDEDWTYLVRPHYPLRVILDNAGQSASYDSSAQVADRILKLTAGGWHGLYETLRVTDPPDLSPYAPDGGCLQGGCTAVPPYEANDNIGMTDYGLSLSPSGPFTASLKARPGQDNQPPDSTDTLIFYLKVPARYSGNNFQVEITKCDGSGTVLPQRVPAMSAVYTSWKRVFVERDKMFRRGGVLYADAAVKDTSIILYKNPDDTRWDNLNSGDKIAIFDTATPYEGPHDEAYAGTITQVGATAPHQMLVTLVTTSGGSTPYQLNFAYTHSPVSSTNWPAFQDPTPPLGTCAAVGVIYSTVEIPSGSGQTITDATANQINGMGSAFYDGDMRDIEQPYEDAYVEFVGLRNGMGAVPYVPGSYFDWVFGNELLRLDSLNYFSNNWFANKILSATPPALTPHNYFHLVGASAATGYYGMTWCVDDWSFLFQQMTEASFPASADRVTAEQWVCDHELGHQFNVNPEGCSGHDTRNAWCDSPDHCGLGGSTSEHCLENVSGTPDEYKAQILDAVNRFDTTDLLTGGEPSGGVVVCDGIDKPWNQGDGAIRTDSDPQ